MFHEPIYSGQFMRSSDHVDIPSYEEDEGVEVRETKLIFVLALVH